MPTADYNQVVSEIKNLDLSDQLRLLEETVTLIRKTTSRSMSRSILELRGKGKEIWKELDVKTYLDEVRSSWNG